MYNKINVLYQASTLCVNCVKSHLPTDIHNELLISIRIYQHLQTHFHHRPWGEVPSIPIKHKTETHKPSYANNKESFRTIIFLTMNWRCWWYGTVLPANCVLWSRNNNWVKWLGLGIVGARTETPHLQTGASGWRWQSVVPAAALTYAD